MTGIIDPVTHSEEKKSPVLYLQSSYILSRSFPSLLDEGNEFSNSA